MLSQLLAGPAEAGHHVLPKATLALVTVGVLIGVPAAGWSEDTASAVVEPNTNERPAGQRSGSTLTLRLVVREGAWHPEGPDSPGFRVAAFAEENGPLLTPGPLVRAPEGTTIAVTIRNALNEPLTMHGFVTRPAAADNVFTVEPGAIREIRFTAGAPGVYSYWGAIKQDAALNTRTALDGQLGGAFIVDSGGAPPDDRVFVMTEWVDPPRFIFAINGQSWPFTERLTEQIGQTVRWKWVNLTRTPHPMHLHGFYFDVLGTGTWLQFKNYEPDAVIHEVTQYLPVGTTMEMRWVPDRPGNWLFHCHLVLHVSPDRRFWAATSHDEHSSHAMHDPASAMAGLVMGVTVVGESKVSHVSAKPPRAITLAMYHRPHFWGEDDAYGFAIKKGATDPKPEDVTVPGPPLILTRGEPVEITLKNGLDEPTAVHWHGIELESVYDGVPGFSGSSGRTTPAIRPGESLVVRFTPPRAGTFIYHTHSHDDHQLTSGLYGAIVVLQPGQQFDPERDHLVVLGMIGQFDAKRPDRIPLAANGSVNAKMTLKAGIPNRLRFINIAANADLAVSLQHVHAFMQWKPVAKDGAELPARQQAPRQASAQIVAAGETYDFEVIPPRDGSVWLDIAVALNGRWIRQVPMTVVQDR